tara:strand:- start:12 stop:614 length:603 start_codon:yes stop_codon:yes gene_type:complete
MKIEPRVIRYEPLKQNIRIWFNYLQTAIKYKFVVDKEYYRTWHLSQVRTLKFDKWYSSHKHLFANKNYVSVRVLDSLSVEDAFKQVKKQLIKKVGKSVPFQITNKRFSYVKVDDYLKCWKLRKEKGLTYQEIGEKIDRDYRKKEKLYTKSSKMIKRKFTKKEIDEYHSTDEVLLQIVRRKVLNAEMIIKNTAKGQFTGKY